MVRSPKSATARGSGREAPRSEAWDVGACWGRPFSLAQLQEGNPFPSKEIHSMGRKCIHWHVKPSPIVIDHLGYAVGDKHMNVKLERNERLLQMQIKDCPTDAFAHYCLGNVYDQLENRDQAIQFYQTSLELDDRQPKAYFLLGNQLLEIAQYNQAEQCYERAHQLAPEVNEVIYNLAVSQIKQSHYDAAIDSFQKLQQRQPHDERVRKYIKVCQQMITHQKVSHT